MTDKGVFRRFVRHSCGLDLIEYALLGAFVAMAAYAGIMYLGSSLSGFFTTVVQSVENQPPVGVADGSGSGTGGSGSGTGGTGSGSGGTGSGSGGSGSGSGGTGSSSGSTGSGSGGNGNRGGGNGNAGSNGNAGGNGNGRGN